MLKNKEKIPSVEEEIERLRQELREKEKALAERKELKELAVPEIKKKEAEKIKEAEKVVEEIKGPKKIAPQKAVSPLMTDEDLLKDLQHVMSLKKPQQIKVLIYLTFKKGVRYAFSIAKQLKNPYLLDELHDTLVDELYNLLTKKHKV